MSKDETVKKLKVKKLRSSKGEKVKDGDMLYVAYQGTLLDGTQFDANYDFTHFEAVTPSQSNFLLQTPNGEFPLVSANYPFNFVLGAGQVIPGWDKALKGRRLGEVFELTIPSDLAYGEQGAGDLIPPDSPLRFTVELLVAGRMDKEGNPTTLLPNIDDLGLDADKLGLTPERVQLMQRVKVGLDKGKDNLIGSNFNDLLIGLGGNDVLDGKAGADVLIGGKGKNRYVFSDLQDSPNAKGDQDQILEFGKKDKIVLSDLADDLEFIGEAKFSGAAGEVRFKKGTLELDVDGDKTADFSVLMPNTDSLKASSLVL